jgi:para-aminobenzoate synthetase/4-amino-4-deoxychorismate lyase
LILLDDANSNAAQPTSRLYQDPCHHWLANHPNQVQATLAEIEQALQANIFVVVVLAYELGQYLQGIPVKPSVTPLIEAFGFTSVKRLSRQEVSDLLERENQPCGVMDLKASCDLAQFTQDIALIHRWIESGDTYQVNHTFQLTGATYGTAAGLYQQLRIRQPSAYGAYVKCQDRTLLSLSPELFLSCQNQQLMAQPMKGTLAKDQHQKTDLSGDEKNRTENLMIVDLIRNDLGRISEIGSVKVPAMFEVEPFGDLYQMTSTVTAKLRANVGLLELLTATFPCGSVTGAPKKRTMEIIQSLEPQPRAIYCGAIGWFDPAPQQSAHGRQPLLGDFAMSVAIRTLEIDQHQKFRLGIGAGITIDSSANSEWHECLIKAGFLTGLPAQVGLFETMRVENGEVPMAKEHLDRMAHSATQLGIGFHRDTAYKVIDQAIANLQPTPPLARLRLNLLPNGELTVEFSPITPFSELTTAPKVFWANDLLPSAAARVSSSNPLFGHKTTDRHAYDAAWQAAQMKGGFDALFINEHGAVTEGGRSNVFIRRGQEWLTPALHCGVLPGVMRAKLLTDPAFQAREAVISANDVITADQVLLVNALRGIIHVDTTALHPISPESL